MKRIVHKEQSQRGIHVVEGFCAQVMEPASEPRAIEVRRISALKKMSTCLQVEIRWHHVNYVLC